MTEETCLTRRFTGSPINPAPGELYRWASIITLDVIHDMRYYMST